MTIRERGPWIRSLCLLAALMIWWHGDPAVTRIARAAGGDPGRGASLFARLPCASCHDMSRPSPGGDVCPNLGNIATAGARTVASPEYRGKAKDAAGYIRESIVDPNAYIVPGPNYRAADGQSIMPKTFGATLSSSEIDDIVAFLLMHR